MGDDSATVPAQSSVNDSAIWREVLPTLDESSNAFLVLECLLLLDQIDLVLENDKVLELHDLHGSQMLGGLWLRARLVCGNKEKRGVHDGRAVKHRSNQNIVSWAVDE